MTALAADNNAVRIKGKSEDIKLYLVEDNVKIYKNGMVVIDSSGYLRPARNTAGETVVGIAVEQVDNTLSGHTAGGKSCRVSSNAHYYLLCSTAVTQASVGQPFYALDDQTARAAFGTGNLVGVVTEFVDATHAWIFIETPNVSSLGGGTAYGGLGQATTAGGGAAGVVLGAAGFGIYFGSGAPSITAVKGSLYIRSDGSSSSTRLYVNTDGATTWTNVTTAA